MRVLGGLEVEAAVVEYSMLRQQQWRIGGRGNNSGGLEVGGSSSGGLEVEATAVVNWRWR